MQRIGRIALSGAVVLLVGIGLASCDNDDATTELTSVRDAVDDVAAACGDRDRDRLQEMTQDRDQLRDRVRDTTFAFGAGTEIDATVDDDDIEIDGDEATVRVVLRVREQNREETTYEETWRFRYENGEWLLSEVPPCADARATRTTLRNGRSGD